MRYSTTVRNEIADVLKQTEGGTCTFYSGTEPSDITTTPAGDNLGSLSIPNPGFTTPSSGEIDLQGDWEGTATAAAGTGTTPDFAILINGSHAVLLTVSLSGGGGELIVDAALEDGGIITVSSLTLTIGGS